jgi:hypothetical protein
MRFTIHGDGGKILYMTEEAEDFPAALALAAEDGYLSLDALDMEAAILADACINGIRVPESFDFEAISQGFLKG